MGVIGAVMRIYSYLFHGLLALFLLGLCVVSWTSGGEHNLRLAILPWEGGALAYLLFASALIGLFSIWLAVKRILPVVLLLWSLVVLVMVVRGFFFSSYRFGQGGLAFALLVSLAALLAVIGSWSQLRKPKKDVLRFDRSVMA